MNIIIEGIDGSGKTVLAKKLCKQYDLEYNHHSKPYTYEEYLDMLNSGKDQLFDRFCVGQFIYNTRDERKMTEGQLYKLMDEISDREDTVFIYVFPKSIDDSLGAMLSRKEIKKEDIVAQRDKLKAWKLRYEMIYLRDYIIQRKIQTYSWEVETTWQPLTLSIQQAYYGTDCMEHCSQMEKK